MDSVRLLQWYRQNRRDLPWRRTRDSYRIWLSEVLLQQTRVDQALPYYERFLKRFPTLRALADADANAVLKAWEGAGYYSRARNLHKAAKMALARWGGLPKTYQDLLCLPGVGSYTAAAVSSIGFGENRAVLDGNVIRVMARLLAEKGDSAKPVTRKKLHAFVLENLPAGKAGDYNQALMELGATVCLPKKPLCAACPLSRDCRAFCSKTQEAFPVKKPKPGVPHYAIACAVVRKNGRILVCQRKPNGLLGGLWEFPGGKVEKGETLAQAAVRETLEETGVRIQLPNPEPFAVVKHAYSHFKITLYAFEADWKGGSAKANPGACQAVSGCGPMNCKDTRFQKPTARYYYAWLPDAPHGFFVPPISPAKGYASNFKAPVIFLSKPANCPSHSLRSRFSAPIFSRKTSAS